MGADPAGKISRLFGVYDENTYIKIIDYETGALFGACMAVGALMAGRKDYWNFYHIGMLAGRAFQLIDDAHKFLRGF